MASKKRYLTGVKPTGKLHIGNYFGGIKNILQYESQGEVFIFIADSHMLTLPKSSQFNNENIEYMIASYLAFDIADKDNIIIYRQSDIESLFELNWILNCFTPKGLLNRSHAFKSATDGMNESDVGMGLFSYPVLMAADIMSMDADVVPVGQDQKQHIEICRDIGQKLNFHISENGFLNNPETEVNGEFDGLKIPDWHIPEEATVIGTDGRKMSKNYSNTIPIFSCSDDLRKSIYGIKTDSTGVNERKEQDTLFDIYALFATDQEKQIMTEKYETGIGWKEVKDMVYEKIEHFRADKKERFDYWVSNKDEMYKKLEKGTRIAREASANTLLRVKKNLGLI